MILYLSKIIYQDFFFFFFFFFFYIYIFFFRTINIPVTAILQKKKREKRGRILSNDSIFSPFILSLEKI